jgi:hypothetical protein
MEGTGQAIPRMNISTARYKVHMAAHKLRKELEHDETYDTI